MFWKQALEHQGLDCQVRNEYLGGAAGELPLNECWPELWLIHDRDEGRACDIMQAINQENAEPQQPWQCPKCHAPGEPGFRVCWNCGADRPED